jgi:hypothetical protein
MGHRSRRVVSLRVPAARQAFTMFWFAPQLVEPRQRVRFPGICAEGLATFTAPGAVAFSATLPHLFFRSSTEACAIGSGGEFFSNPRDCPTR